MVGSRNSEKSSTGDPVRLRVHARYSVIEMVPTATSAGDHRPRQQIEAGDREAEGDAGEADAGTASAP